jgi:hypothetical protein
MIQNPTVNDFKNHRDGSKSLFYATALTSFASSVGLILWQWLKNNRSFLPDPEESAGNALAGQYLGTAYDLFLIVLLSAIIYLGIKIAREKHHEFSRESRVKKFFGSRLVSFVKSNPVVTVIFTVYTVLLVQEATWFHGELIGWIQDVFRDNFLSNFSIRYDFVSETLRREDYRLFPLSHQDLHVYTWFTPYVKVMMLISAVQLITVVVCAKRLAENISGNKSAASLLLISALLTLFCASIANAFFQLDYPERMLTFLLSMYSLTYLHYLRHRDRSSFYITFLLALLGMYWKDTGFILFIFPAAIVIGANFLPFPNLLNTNGEGFVHPLKNWRRFYSLYKLELWLCWLFSAFIMSYIYLSLIPSTYLDTEAYGSTSAGTVFSPIIRFWILVSFTIVRLALILARRKNINLLDILNISAITYAFALYELVGFKGYSYQYAPIEFITIVNILVLWCWASKRLDKKLPSKHFVGIVGFAITLLFIGYEHLDKRYSFYGHVSRVHELHNSWEQTYDKIDQITRERKKNGDQVNIIYSSQSWFDKSRHLDRLRYDRLIEWNPGYGKFFIKDGIGPYTEYIPQTDDLYINIDRTDSILPTQPNITYELIYQFNHKHTGRPNGQIYKIKALD